MELDSQKEYLKTTLRSIGDGVIAVDLSCNVTFINNITADLTGWTMEEASGRPLEEVFNIGNEFTYEKCVNPAETVIETGEIVELSKNTCLISKRGD